MTALLQIFALLIFISTFFGLSELMSMCLRKDLHLWFWEKTVLGLAIFTLVGGGLAYFKIFSMFSAAVVAMAGIAAGINRYSCRDDMLQFWRSLVPSCRLAVVVSTILTVGFVFSTLRLVWISPGDDMQGYFVLIRGLIDTGGLHRGVFSEKRALALGGQFILQALGAKGFGFTALSMIDASLSTIITIGLSAEYMLRNRGNALLIVSITIAVLLLNSLLVLVNSPTILLQPVFLAILLLCWRIPMWYGGPTAIVLGFLFAFLVSLRTTAIPIVGFYIAATATLGILATKEIKLVSKGTLIFVFTAIGVLAPFLAMQYSVVATPLYPLTGLGNQGLEFGDGLLGRANATMSATVALILGQRPYFVLLLCSSGFFALAFAGRSGMKAIIAMVMILTTIFVPWVSIAAGDKDQAVRYGLGFYSAELILLFLVLCSEQRLRPNQKSLIELLGQAIGILGISFLASLGVKDHAKQGIASAAFAITGDYEVGVRFFKRFLNLEIIPFIEASETYVKLQNSVPAGERILVSVDRAYLFDQARNQIELIDCPGRVSPFPGIPINGTPQDLAAYLVGQNLRYIAYSYGNSANYSRITLLDRLEGEPWGRICTKNLWALQDRFLTLMKVSSIVYDDGIHVVMKIPSAQ